MILDNSRNYLPYLIIIIFSWLFLLFLFSSYIPFLILLVKNEDGNQGAARYQRSSSRSHYFYIWRFLSIISLALTIIEIIVWFTGCTDYSWSASWTIWWTFLTNIAISIQNKLFKAGSALRWSLIAWFTVCVALLSNRSIHAIIIVPFQRITPSSNIVKNSKIYSSTALATYTYLNSLLTILTSKAIISNAFLANILLGQMLKMPNRTYIKTCVITL